MNGSDCGMFTCKFAEYISRWVVTLGNMRSNIKILHFRRAKITFSQGNMPYFRQRMIFEIVMNQLLHP